MHGSVRPETSLSKAASKMPRRREPEGAGDDGCVSHPFRGKNFVQSVQQKVGQVRHQGKEKAK